MKLIGLTGKKRSGKDTFVSMFRETLGKHETMERLAFADEVKFDCARMLQTVTGVDNDIWLRKFNDENKQVFRPLLQWYGTDFVRQFYNDKDHWVSILRKKLTLYTARKFVFVTDVRFPNEADLIQELGGVVVKLVRPSFEEDLDTHISENMDIPYKYKYICADLDQLREAVADLRQKL